MSVPSNLTPLRLTQMQQYLGSDTSGTIYYVLNGISYQAQLSTLFSYVGGGTVTSVDVSGGATGLSFTGGPITINGTITAGGTLNVSHGGTGAATAADARVSILPSFTGNANKVLAVNAGESDVEFVTPGDGTVTSIDASGGTTGLSFSGGPITSTGTLTLDGMLEIANGGTGAGNASGARMSLLPAYSGNAGKVLAVNGGATDAEWIAISGAGTVTSVNVSGGATGLSFSGGPITGAGTITASGTLGVANGGTGQTSFTNGQLLIGNTTGNTLVKATLAGSAGITVTNGPGSITLATPITTTGDIILGDGANSATRLAIGANGTVLTSNGATASWASPAGAGWTQIATLSPSNASDATFSSIPDTYSELLMVMMVGPSNNATAQVAFSSDNTNFSNALAISGTLTAAAVRGGLWVPGYASSNNAGMAVGSMATLTTTPTGLSSSGGNIAWRLGGKLTAIRLSMSAGTFSGVLRLYGK